MDRIPEKPSLRFLSFANDKEDAEKEAKLREAAQRIDQAIARQNALSELVDYQPQSHSEEPVDLANDTRPLFERLLEQKNKKREALEESQKLSNLVTKLDEEDAGYLNEVTKAKHEEELKKRLEVYDAMEQKRRLDEKKILEEEKRIKESLVSSKMSIKNCPLRTKLSNMIKMKPRVRPNERISSGSQVHNRLEQVNSQVKHTDHSDSGAIDYSKKESAASDEGNEIKRRRLG